MKLRPYQQDLVQGSRSILSQYMAALIQLATGGGKTAIFSEITRMAASKASKVWIVVPRAELMQQTSETLDSIKVKHNKITPKHKESILYDVHIAMQMTLINRIKADKIKNWPNLIIFDEAHLSIDQQKTIKDAAPNTTKFIGVTATPERLDGRGLSEVYDDIVYGPSIAELQEMGFLSKMKYFCPPVEGIKKLHKSGYDYKKDEVAELLEKKHVYGSAIAHYRKYADGKPCLVFCPSVKLAEETAERFNAEGYNFMSIDGKSVDRKGIIEKLRTGEIDGLTSCELITYGLDVPRVECIIMLRPTLSKVLFFQMIGRGLRPSPGKEYCIILDHVNNLLEHGHPLNEQEWGFEGDEKCKKKKGDDIAVLSLCGKCFMYYEGATCDNCGAAREIKDKDGMVEVEGRLIEAQAPEPVKFKDRPFDERRDISSKRKELVASRSVAELIELEHGLGNNNPMRAYHLIVDGGPLDEALLREIASIKGYKAGWVNSARVNLERRG